MQAIKKKPTVISALFLLALAMMFSTWPARAVPILQFEFASGDVFVGLRTGEVQWRGADGSLKKLVIGNIPGKVEGMELDAAGNLYVSHYCADAMFCMAGNTVEKFDSAGNSQGAFGSGYSCNPYSITFDSSGNVYVGQADCSGSLLNFDAAGNFLRSLQPLGENRGTAWVDLAADNCTLFYTSQGSKVMRYDVCTAMQLPDFHSNLSSTAHQMTLLPDGGVLVATDAAIVRLSAAGTVAQNYDVPGEPELWYGVALAGDGSFWASNYGSSNVYRFDLASGSVLGMFNAGTPTTTVKGLAVSRH